MLKHTFSTPIVPVSWGELVDKITILEIKKIHISRPNALTNIDKELVYLNALLLSDHEVVAITKEYKMQLLDVNLRLWKVEDDIRDKELLQEFDTIFIELARSVYRLNDERAKLKKAINLALNSELVEEKSYKNFQQL
jgi:hypothetical protein